MTESDYEDLKKHALPALKHEPSDQLHIGKRGQTHMELKDEVIKKHPDKIVQNEPHPGYATINWKRGYYHMKNKKFYNADESGDLEATDLMSPLQRQRHFDRLETRRKEFIAQRKKK